MTLRMGSAGEFAQVKKWLRDLSFDQATVTAALGIPNISHLRDLATTKIDGSRLSASLLAAIDLWIGGEAIPAERLRSCCDDDTFAALLALDLIRQINEPKGSVVSPVWLYPVGPFLIASDRQTQPDSLAPDELVFPAHDAGTLRLLQLLPAGAAGDALDLCGGTGIAALHLAKAGMRAVSTDIVRRSSHFALFNARLNGLEPECLCGDLFAPVTGRTFDLICCHPPWLPSLGDGMVFRDGGDTGDSVVGRIVMELAGYLRPGGTAILLCMGRDGRDASFEQRLQRWLGTAEASCDIVVGISRILSIEEMVGSIQQLHLKQDPARAARLLERFRELSTEKFVYCATFIRRTDAHVAVPPLRLRMSAQATASDFERIFAWRRFRRRTIVADWLAARPRVTEGLSLSINHVVREGTMVPTAAEFRTKGPLSAIVRADVWAAHMIAEFDGRRTIAGIFETHKTASRIPPDFTCGAFADLVSQMVERGVLELDLAVAEQLSDCLSLRGI